METILDAGSTRIKPAFAGFIGDISKQSPFQRKRLLSWLDSCDESFFEEAEEFVVFYKAFLAERGLSFENAASSYLAMCNTMLKYQINYLRTRTYPKATAEESKKNVYDNANKMLPYMVGLAISQFTWPHHYKMFHFFKEAIREARSSLRSYLEIGPGHGLFTAFVIGQCPDIRRAVAIDISATSLNLSRDIINKRKAESGIQTPVEFITGDVMETEFHDRFDFITMGEVLEHVDRPLELLAHVKTLLAPGGTAFISTCANCPMIDHVVEFHRVDEIRSMLREAGFAIKKDLALPSEPISVEEAEAKRTSINYCALVY